VARFLAVGDKRCYDRATKSTLQATLLVGCRVGGRVRHEQVAALGPIKLPLTGRAPHRGRRGYTWSTGMGFEPVGLSNLVEEIRHARAGIEAGDAKMSSRIASSNPSTLCSSDDRPEERRQQRRLHTLARRNR
jgi:hypothetical protein